MVSRISWIHSIKLCLTTRGKRFGMRERDVPNLQTIMIASDRVDS